MNKFIAKTGKVLLFLFALLSCWSCAEDAVETTGSIFGKVTNSKTGEILQGVSITLNPGGLSRTTGSDGTYEFLNLEAQQYQVQAQKAGFLDDFRSVSVLVGQAITCDIRLEPENKDADITITPSSLNFGASQEELSVTI